MNLAVNRIQQGVALLVWKLKQFGMFKISAVTYVSSFEPFNWSEVKWCLWVSYFVKAIEFDGLIIVVFFKEEI